MGYLNNIITADAGCSTADKGYSIVKTALWLKAVQTEHAD